MTFCNFHSPLANFSFLSDYLCFSDCRPMGASDLCMAAYAGPTCCSTGVSCPFLSCCLIDNRITSSQSISSQRAFTAVFRPFFGSGLFACVFFSPTLIVGVIKDITSPHKPWLFSLHMCSLGAASRKTTSSSLEFPYRNKW